MNRASWRDVVVDVSTILILFGAVLLKLWTMSSAAPWMIAIAAGRWGASTISKYAAAKVAPANLVKSVPPPSSDKNNAPPVTIAAGADGASPASRLPPPASLASRTPIGEDLPEVEEQEDVAPTSKPLPTGGIVLILFAIGSAIVLFLKNRSA
jgi:hypothetical protein